MSVSNKMGEQPCIARENGSRCT